MPRTTEEILAHADELAKRFEDYEPREEDERDPAVLAQLRAAVVARAEAERLLTQCIAAAKEGGLSWATIGTEVGTSGEAVRQKYGTPAGIMVEHRPAKKSQRKVAHKKPVKPPRKNVNKRVAAAMEHQAEVQKAAKKRAAMKKPSPKKADVNHTSQ